MTPRIPRLNPDTQNQDRMPVYASGVVGTPYGNHTQCDSDSRHNRTTEDIGDCICL
jgi:hypothetical protein